MSTAVPAFNSNIRAFVLVSKARLRFLSCCSLLRFSCSFSRSDAADEQVKISDKSLAVVSSTGCRGDRALVTLLDPVEVSSSTRLLTPASTLLKRILLQVWPKEHDVYAETVKLGISCAICHIVQVLKVLFSLQTLDLV